MKALEWLLQFLLLLVVVMGVFTFGPTLETRFLPVYSRFTIDQLYPDDQGVRVRFRYTKLRACDSLGFAFYVGDPAHTFQPLVVDAIDGMPPPRPVGEQISNLYRIRGVTTEQFRREVFGIISNRCGPWWATQTRIYP